MKEISDEILNKYLDNELDKETQIYVTKELKTSAELQRRYYALKLIHANLSKISEEKVSEDFTATVMKRLPGKVKVMEKDRRFIFSISSIFVIASLIITGVVMSGMFGTIRESNTENKFMENIYSFVESSIQAVIGLFSTQNLSIFGSIISFGVIITGYFFFEFYKRTDTRKI